VHIHKRIDKKKICHLGWLLFLESVIKSTMPDKKTNKPCSVCLSGPKFIHALCVPDPQLQVHVLLQMSHHKTTTSCTRVADSTALLSKYIFECVCVFICLCRCVCVYVSIHPLVIASPVMIGYVHVYECNMYYCDQQRDLDQWWFLMLGVRKDTVNGV
jgi:hypothetical protein